jgi:hypothetical protein
MLTNSQLKKEVESLTLQLQKEAGKALHYEMEKTADEADKCTLIEKLRTENSNLRGDVNSLQDEKNAAVKKLLSYMNTEDLSPRI